MIKSRRFPRIFFGWRTVIGGGLLRAWTSGFTLYGFAALFKPLSAELGFSRAVTSVAASIGRFEGSLESPLSGWATDKFGPRWVVLISVFLIASGLMLMYYVNSLWAFYLVWGVMVGAGTNLSMIPLDTAVANWFVKKRGLALGMKWFVNGLSGVVTLPFVAWLITAQGWRVTALLGGIGTLVVGLPIVWFCLRRHRPEYYGLMPDGAPVETAATEQTIERGIRYAAEVEEVEFTLRQALRSPGFWLLVVAIASHGLVMAVITIHSLPFLTDIGFGPVRAAATLAMANGVGLPLRLVGGLLADRIKRDQIRFLLAGAYFLQAAGFTIFLLHQTIPMIYVWFIVYGFGSGLGYTQFPTWGRYFGRKAIGSIRGISNLFTSPVAIAAPIWAGWVYDTTGSYITVFTVAAILLGASVILIFLARPPSPPAEVTDIRKIV